MDTVNIKLDGSLKSDLSWGAQKKLAEKSKNILWEIDLGLFSGLQLPLSDETQSKSLRLSLDVFHRDIWEKYQDRSLGLCVYRGSADFTKEFFDFEQLQDWLRDAFSRDIGLFTRETGIEAQGFEEIDEAVLRQNEVGAHLLNLFCCQSCVEYLDFLCQDLPDSLPLFVELDTKGVKNVEQITSRERFERFHLLPEKKEEPSNIAICLPPISKILPSQNRGLTEAIDDLNRRKLHFRIIPEPYLTMEWDGLDYLLYIPEGLSDLGERKLQGFCAAGGTVVALGPKIGLSGELTFDEWTEKLLETL